MNGYPGFNQYIVSLRNSLDEENDPDAKKTKVIALRDALYSFIRFDAIVDNRFYRDKKSQYARLDDRHYRRKTVVGLGDCALRVHQDQLRNLVKEVAKEYGEDLTWLYEDKFGLDAEGEKKQKEYEQRLEELKEHISSMVLSDNGEKAMRVIKRAEARDKDSQAGLRGIETSKRPTLEQLAAIKVSAHSKELEPYRGGGGHGH